MKKVTSCFWCQSDKFSTIAERKDGVGIQQCESCRLIMVAELPDDLGKYYEDEEYFNPDIVKETGYLENYDLISPFYLFWQRALISEIHNRWDKKSLLEIGCATGNLLEMLSEFDKEMRCCGIDLSSYAIKICKEKGLLAYHSKINDFKAKKKFDIIFSSETMEHVNELREFMDGVIYNLDPKGLFIFYIPAVDEDALKIRGKEYISLKTNLEHVIYFTKSFLENALSKFFNSDVYIHQSSTSDGYYILGAVSKEKKLLSSVKEFILNLERDGSSYKNPQTLFNLITITAKFSNFKLAKSYLKKYEDGNITNNNHSLYFLRGLIAYHEGRLVDSTNDFQKYLKSTYPNEFMLKVLLSNEKEFNKILLNDMQELNKLELKVLAVETKLKDLEDSKSVKVALRAQQGIGKFRRLLKKYKKSTKAKQDNKVVHS